MCYVYILCILAAVPAQHTTVSQPLHTLSSPPPTVEVPALIVDLSKVLQLQSAPVVEGTCVLRML